MEPRIREFRFLGMAEALENASGIALMVGVLQERLAKFEAQGANAESEAAQ